MNILKPWAFKKEPKAANKFELNIKQRGNRLNISGVLKNPEFLVTELWLISRDKSEEYKIAEIDPSNRFEFQIDLDELLKQLIENSDETIFDWFFKIEKPYTDTDQASDNMHNGLSEINGRKYIECFLRCGRFRNTYVEGLSYNRKGNHYLMNFITENGNISLKLNEELAPSIKMQIDKINNRKGIFHFEGKIFTKTLLINKGELILKGRETKKEYALQSIVFHRMEEQTVKKYGLNRYKYTAKIDFHNLEKGQLPEDDVFDLYLKLHLNDSEEERYVRVGRPTFRAKLFLKDLSAKNDREAIVVNPYFTFKQANLSFEIYKFPLETYIYLKKMMKWSRLIQLINRNKNVWLVGERIYKAQDTGYAFFKYMRENHPKAEVYYVIDHNSRERENVEKFGNVLGYKSKEHIFQAIIAKKVISSHHPDYLYPIRTEAFKRKVKADKIFLQHGVMGTKNMVMNYGKNAPSGFETDFFIVSSDFEKEMIINDFGYAPDEVFVTGLSRFDSLFKNDVEQKRQILIIPTWRDWIINDEVFFESEYYARYKNLINNTHLHYLAQEYQFSIVFCLHPNMQRFSKYFENDAVKIINQGEVDVQRLIKESALMITDYSSVGFDFSFLYKPVIYYQFDRNRFIGKYPSHLDLDNDLPGEICYEERQIIDLVKEYCENQFEMKQEYKNRADIFIKYRDQSSSERIFEVITNNRRKRFIYNNSKLSLLKSAIYNRFRKSKYYFPSMKLFYKIGSKFIKADDNLILFESGLGKQFADSPRYIYEEILRQNLDYKKIWVYNKPIRFNDPNTKRIERLSPAYYYYLLKAGYWVNNQNFPTYIKKRPQTKYLQTWHGTPLKKMLYDLDKVYGRDEGYIERVGEAIRNWDYLISPSPYATKAFKSAFRFNGNILELGYPRNDIFYKPEKEKMAHKVRNRLNLPRNKKVILYAPTFRDNQTSKKNQFSFDLKMDLEQMKAELGDEYIVLLRMHVVVNDRLTIDESLEDFVWNVSDYPEIQELLLITDVLITDYSSVMFDFVNTGKPMLFFTYDIEEYRDHLRGFYLNFEEEAPGPLVYNTAEIIDNIKNIESVQETFDQKYKTFREKYCPLEDGFASKRVVDLVFKSKK